MAQVVGLMPVHAQPCLAPGVCLRLFCWQGTGWQCAKIVYQFWATVNFTRIAVNSGALTHDWGAKSALSCRLGVIDPSERILSVADNRVLIALLLASMGVFALLGRWVHP